MAKESITKATGLTILSAVFIFVSYLFYQSGSQVLHLIPLFIGIILALVLVEGYRRSGKSK